MECHCHHSSSELVEIHWLLWDTEISSYNINNFKVKHPLKKGLRFGKSSLWATPAQHTDWFADFEHVCWCSRLPQKTPEYLCNSTAENTVWDFLRNIKSFCCVRYTYTHNSFLLILKCSLWMVIQWRTTSQTLNHLNTHYPKKKHINYQWVAKRDSH